MQDNKSPSEILDCSIGGFTAMRGELLKSASQEGGSKIPSRWSTNKLYAQLELDGLVTEGAEVAKGSQRQWLITDAGRSVLEKYGRAASGKDD